MFQKYLSERKMYVANAEFNFNIFNWDFPEYINIFF